MKILDPSDPRFVPVEDRGYDLVAGGEKIACDRRMPRKNPVKYALLPDTVRNALPECVFEVSMPTRGRFLDMERVQKNVVSRKLGTIVVSRATLRAMGTQTVGTLVPVFGQVRQPKKLNKESALLKNCAPISDDHAFAFAPVVISTTGGDGDQGEIVSQGIVVSNKVINRAVGDSRRRTLGRNPVFEETVCFVMITHVYDPSLTYLALGPPGTKKRGDAYEITSDSKRNVYESTFLWEEFMKTRTEERCCGVSSFGFTDTKQSGKDVVRSMFPWTVHHAASVLEGFRKHDDLRRFLLETPMTLAGKRALSRKECPSGIDIRRFLLAELLLKKTPLEPLLRNEPPVLHFPAPCIDELKDHSTTSA